MFNFVMNQYSCQYLTFVLQKRPNILKSTMSEISAFCNIAHQEILSMVEAKLDELNAEVTIKAVRAQLGRRSRSLNDIGSDFQQLTRLDLL